MSYIAEHDGVLVIIGRQQTPESIIAQVCEFEAQDKGEQNQQHRRQMRPGTSV